MMSGNVVEPGKALDQVAERMNMRVHKFKHPMSSPIRQPREDTHRHQRSRSHEDVPGPTLTRSSTRRAKFVPPQQQQRLKRREELRVASHGGWDAMGAEVLRQEAQEEQQIRQREAAAVAGDYEYDADVDNDDEDVEQMRLEEMLKMEEIEMLELIRDIETLEVSRHV